MDPSSFSLFSNSYLTCPSLLLGACYVWQTQHAEYCLLHPARHSHFCRKAQVAEHMQLIVELEISEESGGQASLSDDSSVKTSILEFLQQSDRETQVEDSKLKYSEESNRRIETTAKEKSRPTPQTPSANEFTRPASKFVKRSPIPSSTPSQSTDVEVTDTEMSSSEADKESSSVEGMKLSELKKLAKERGMRGYSKLKKIELLQLLKP